MAFTQICALRYETFSGYNITYESLIRFISPQNVLWRFKFSQLKGSSDDGKTRVKLLFQNPDTKQIETKVKLARTAPREKGQLVKRHEKETSSS